MAEDTNYVTLEVAIDSSLYDNLIHAAANRGQSVSEFVESVLDREVEQALSETPVEVRDPQDEEHGMFVLQKRMPGWAEEI